MSECYIGEIRPFAGNFAPAGWAFCDGSLKPISDNQTLYSLIGTTYGGDGQTTFGLPDLRGRTVIHQGTAADLSAYVTGEQVGLETVGLSTGQMPAHTHSFAASATEGNTPNPAPSVVLASTPGGFPIYDGAAGPVALSSQSVSTAGGSTSHDNRQPYLAITYIISLDGLFPSQS